MFGEMYALPEVARTDFQRLACKVVFPDENPSCRVVDWEWLARLLQCECYTGFTSATMSIGCSGSEFDIDRGRVVSCTSSGTVVSDRLRELGCCFRSVAPPGSSFDAAPEMRSDLFSCFLPVSAP